MPRQRLGTLLTGIVLAVAVPALLVGAAAIYLAVRSANDAASARLLNVTKVLAMAVDREFDGEIAALTALATSPAFDDLDAPGNVQRLYVQARQVAAALDFPVSVSNRNGINVLSTLVPLETPTPPKVGLDAIERTFATGRPVVSDLIFGHISHAYIISINVPVKGADGRVTHVVAGTVEVPQFQKRLKDADLPGFSIAGVEDARHTIVARSDAVRTGVPVTEASIRARKGRDSGLSRSRADGTDRVYAFKQLSSAPGWSVVVAEPAREFDQAWWRPLSALAVGGGVALAFGCAVMLRTRRQILTPLQQLESYAATIVRFGGASPAELAATALPPAPIAELETLRRGFTAAEHALRRDAAEITELFQASPIGIARCERSGRMADANAAALSMFGATREDLETGRLRWNELTPPEHLSATVAAINEARASPDRRSRPYEKQYQRLDGTRIPVLNTLALVDPETGDGAVFMLDLTEIHRYHQAQLAQAAKMEALGRLAGGVAHDFNNVLHTVQVGADLTKAALVKDLAKADHYLKMISDAASRGCTVTGRLLAFARRSDLSAEPIQAAVLFDGLLQFLRPTMGSLVTLRAEANPSLPSLLADPAQLETVLVNLANNARDAFPQGAGTIRLVAAEAIPADLSPAELPPGRYIRLAVIDDGEGMPPDLLARVSEPFFTTKPSGRGTGLGLAMAKGFAEQSGGALTIHSVLGQGTTVALFFPLAPPRV